MKFRIQDEPFHFLQFQTASGELLKQVWNIMELHMNKECESKRLLKQYES